MKRLLVCALAALALGGFAADVKKIAVFVQNRTTTPGMDTLVGGIREQVVAAFAEVEGFSIVDSTMATDAFNQSPNIARTLGCDYVVAVGIVGASSVTRSVNGQPSTVYTLRMTTKVTDADGASVDGMPTWKQSFPVLNATDDPINYYQNLVDMWAVDVTRAIATKAPRWRAGTPAAALVSFGVSTTIDGVIAALESQTKGAKGEQLAELRKVVGGVSVEIDGAVVGTTPGTFRASPGLHKLRVTRDWMKPYEATVSVREGTKLEVALEMSEAGIAKWGSLEGLRAGVAKSYADAAMTRGIKINVDSTNWRDVGTGALRIKE